MARAPDEGIRHREVERHAERVGDEDQDEEEGRRDERGAQEPLAVEQFPDPGRGAGNGPVEVDAIDAHADHPLTIRFISFSAQATASLVDVPVTALATMLGRMYSFVMRWILSVPGAGQP